MNALSIEFELAIADKDQNKNRADSLQSKTDRLTIQDKNHRYKACNHFLDRQSPDPGHSRKAIVAELKMAQYNNI